MSFTEAFKAIPQVREERRRETRNGGFDESTARRSDTH